MENRKFAFRYPPPPPPPSNFSTPILPPLPTDRPPLPPGMPPPELKPPLPPSSPPAFGTNRNWLNWPLNVDFSQPPPPVYGSDKTNKSASTNNGVNLMRYGYKVRPITTPIQNLSPVPSQDNSVYYGIKTNTMPSNISNYSSKQYSSKRYTDQASNNQSWMQKSRNLQKSRNDGRAEYNSNPVDLGFYRSNVSRYSRGTPSSEVRFPFSKDTNSIDSNSSNDAKSYEDGHRCRKRKKPLSQTVPAKRAWTDEEAQIAIDVEREYNKIGKSQSLKIKFPDQELNRDIVTKFHPSIESVYFQQPSNPRFCFVTLTEEADPDAVIEQLNKIKFGLGYLSAECKKDREEEQNVGPDDIDPLTLYVGNLAQEVTKEDMVKFFPKNKRIDIGFAKKMRYTRYAFVSFKNFQDSIEAFKATHYADLYSKSIIVRFRRLHGTVGMPGEPKSQPTSKDAQDDGKKNEESSTTSDMPTSCLEPTERLETDEIDADSGQPINSTYSPPSPSAHHNHYDRTVSECSDSSNFDPSLVKSEPYEYSDDYEDSHSDNEVTRISEEVEYGTVSRSVDLEALVKKEHPLEDIEMPFPVRPIPLKEEPDGDETNSACSDEEERERGLHNGLQEPKKEIEYEEPANPEVNEEEFNTTTDFGSVLDNLNRSVVFMP